MRTPQLPGYRVKMLVRMLARRVLMALKARLSLGAWVGGVERGLGEAGSGQSRKERRPRLGSLERLICGDRASASVGLCSPCLQGTSASSADWWVALPARAVPSQHLKGGSHELMSL